MRNDCISGRVTFDWPTLALNIFGYSSSTVILEAKIIHNGNGHVAPVPSHVWCAIHFSNGLERKYRILAVLDPWMAWVVELKSGQWRQIVTKAIACLDMGAKRGY